MHSLGCIATGLLFLCSRLAGGDISDISSHSNLKRNHSCSHSNSVQKATSTCMKLGYAHFSALCRYFTHWGLLRRQNTQGHPSPRQRQAMAWRVRGTWGTHLYGFYVIFSTSPSPSRIPQVRHVDPWLCPPLSVVFKV